MLGGLGHWGDCEAGDCDVGEIVKLGDCDAGEIVTLGRL